MSVLLSSDENSNLIRLDDEIDIAVAAELKAVLLDALKSGRETRVSFDAATALDLTAFQLLWAAAREGRQTGLKFALPRELSEPIQSSLQCMGLDGLLVG